MRIKKSQLLILPSLVILLATILPTVHGSDYYTWDSATHGTSIDAPLGQIGSEAIAYADASGLTKVYTYGGFGIWGTVEAWADLYLTLTGQGYTVKPMLVYEAKGGRFNGGIAKITLTVIDRSDGSTIGQWYKNLPYSPTSPTTDSLEGASFYAYSDRQYLYWVRVYAKASITLNGIITVDYEGSSVFVTDGYVKVQYLRIEYEGGSGGGCPYVYTWNGQRYVMDNNLLPASEMSNGADVEDYYKLEQTLVPTYEGRLFSFYSLQISEFEHEHSYLDQVKLLAVDHPPSVNVAVSPYGEILTYSNPAPPICAVDEYGIDVLSQLNSIDENYYQGYNGSYVTLTFGPTDVSNGVKLVIRDDERPPLLKCPVYVQVLNATQGWNTVATFHTRTYWATDIINMKGYLPDPEGNLKVRFCFISNDKIDYVGLDTTPQASVETNEARLISAVHSTQGNVKPLLMKNDQTYAELIPGEQIQLTFRLQNNQNEERTFILYAEGHYSTIAP